MNTQINNVYIFVSVVTAGASQCELQGRLPVTATTGFLSSLQTESKGLGTRSCPWILKAKTGQRLALSLLYFNPLGDDPSLKQGCGYQLAEVIDGGDTVTVSTCDGQDSSRPYYVSKTNQLTIQLVSRATLEMLGKFLISYQGINSREVSCRGCHNYDSASTFFTANNVKPFGLYLFLIIIYLHVISFVYNLSDFAGTLLSKWALLPRIGLIEGLLISAAPLCQKWWIVISPRCDKV